MVKRYDYVFKKDKYFNRENLVIKTTNINGVWKSYLYTKRNNLIAKFEQPHAKEAAAIKRITRFLDDGKTVLRGG
jgi:hypothetical protein